jgi:hypothetical protein
MKSIMQTRVLIIGSQMKENNMQEIMKKLAELSTALDNRGLVQYVEKVDDLLEGIADKAKQEADILKQDA